MNSIPAPPAKSISDSVAAFWLGPADPVRLDAFRAVLGLPMLLYFSAWWRWAPEWLTAEGFHASQAVYPWAPVFPLLPKAALPWFGALFFSSLAAWTLGWKTEWTCPTAFAGTVYVTYADPLSAYTLNKMFIVSLAVFLCVPHGLAWNIDKKKRPAAASSVWPVRILQATLLIHYFFAGWEKVVRGDWLKDPYVLWTQVQGVYRTGAAAWMLQAFPPGIWSFMQYAALAFELSAPVLFLSKRLRPVGLLWGAAFQILVALTMHQLIYFSLQMLSFYVLFLDPAWLHALEKRLGGGRGEKPATSTT